MLIKFKQKILKISGLVTLALVMGLSGCGIAIPEQTPEQVEKSALDLLEEMEPVGGNGGGSGH